MGTYYHVADATYRAGEDLWCRDELEAMGTAPEWHWEDAEEGFDTDVVCLFADRDEAEAFRRDFAPTGTLLVVELPDDTDAHGLSVTTVAEGYPAVYRRIPAEYIR